MTDRTSDVTIRWTANRMLHDDDPYAELMNEETIRQVKHFHHSFPQYQPTPLISLSRMAEHLGLSALKVKDESFRFGLNAFKVLGGSYAMARCIAERTGRAPGECDYAYLTGEGLRREFGQTTFVTATDGNHGRGVAWSARMLGQRAVVRMPMGTTSARLENIAKEGAEVTIENLNYDACVRLAARQAEELGGVLLQDTAWAGYEKIPAWIMQGYGTMVAEAAEQFGGEIPTHLFIQAGVGSLAGAVCGYFAKRYGEQCPKIVVMEPTAADCHYQSALFGDGLPHAVEGEMRTLMAGLACGEPNPVSFSILKNHAAAFVSCADGVTELGMRLLAAPLKGDTPVTSGESGAVGMGLCYLLMTGGCEELRSFLGLGRESRVLLFSTEGNTDPERYQSIVWGLGKADGR